MSLIRIFFITIIFLFVNNLNAKKFAECKEYFRIEVNDVKEQTFLEKILNEDSQNVDCMLKLASIYFNKSRASDAVDLVRRAFALKPKYVQKKKIAKILDISIKLSRLKEKAIKENSIFIWNELGSQYYEMGFFRDAINAYLNSLNIDNSQAVIQVNIGIIYANLDEIYTAIGRFKMALSIDPENFYANYNLGKVLKNELCNINEGNRYLRVALKILKTKPDIFKDKNEFQYFKDDIEKELEIAKK